tara:strand:+ start:808 stop:1041 length:234 start_codon:yes stop_codon:yes gene_type:complete
MSKDCYADRRGLVLCPSSVEPVLVLDKINAPFLYGSILETESPYNLRMEIKNENVAYLDAIGILHTKVCTLINADKV